MVGRVEANYQECVRNFSRLISVVNTGFFVDIGNMLIGEMIDVE